MQNSTIVASFKKEEEDLNKILQGKSKDFHIKSIPFSTIDMEIIKKQ